MTEPAENSFTDLQFNMKMYYRKPQGFGGSSLDKVVNHYGVDSGFFVYSTPDGVVHYVPRELLHEVTISDIEPVDSEEK